MSFIDVQPKINLRIMEVMQNTIVPADAADRSYTLMLPGDCLTNERGYDAINASYILSSSLDLILNYLQYHNYK